MKRLPYATALLALCAGIGACIDAEVEDGENDGFPSGKADGGIDEGSPEAIGVLRLVNDASESAASLKSGAGVTTRVATNIVKHRDGADGAAGTADDDKFDTLAELDAIPYVGPATLNALLERARDKGYVAAGGVKLDVMFSPLPAAQSHNARIAQLIRGAQHTIDVAIYSYSDAGIAAALKDRAEHGVKVRFIFDTAAQDRKVLDPTARAATKSGRIEAQGIDVRYMNKTMHHKFVLIDGPRDVRERAATAKLVMGSANWSASAATDFDENTVFVEGSAEMMASFQHEFDKLWQGSRDFVGPAPSQLLSTVKIKPSDVADDAGIAALFTSDNFTAAGSDGTTWRVDRAKMALTAAWNAAIDRAQTSIHIATTHLRLRPFVDKLVAVKQARPALDIKVYLDQQEYISPSGDTAQKAEVDTCLAAATTETQRLNCLYNDFLFSKALVDAGITVRFKSYAYRWDHSYAAQMHSKYMVVDGKEVLTGSFNASMNSEQATFESGLHVFGTQYAALIQKFEQNFTAMWDVNRAALAPLRAKITADSTIPIVFPSMALTYQEFGDLRALIRAQCPAVDSEDFRSNAAAHRSCTK
jgi:phosphatidylserine/phosphatidylglycerophosphate/cardiolipin synthase-like enzyme